MNFNFFIVKNVQDFIATKHHIYKRIYVGSGEYYKIYWFYLESK